MPLVLNRVAGLVSDRQLSATQALLRRQTPLHNQKFPIGDRSFNVEGVDDLKKCQISEQDFIKLSSSDCTRFALEKSTAS